MRKLKGFSKGLISSFCLILSAPIYSSCETYLGIGIGPEYAEFKKRALVINRPPEENTRVIEKTWLAGRGGFASIFAGFGYRFPGCNPNCETLYIGVEANANRRKVRFKETNEEFVFFDFGHETYEMRRSYGISLLPGIFFSDCTLFYGRLGYENGKFYSDSTDTTLQNLTKNLGGFRYGLGFRQGFNSCWAFRIEYSQTNYKKVKMSTFTLPNTLKNTSFTTYTQRFEVGLLYTF